MKTAASPFVFVWNFFQLVKPRLKPEPTIIEMSEAERHKNREALATWRLDQQIKRDLYRHNSGTFFVLPLLIVAATLSACGSPKNSTTPESSGPTVQHSDQTPTETTTQVETVTDGAPSRPEASIYLGDGVEKEEIKVELERRGENWIASKPVKLTGSQVPRNLSVYAYFPIEYSGSVNGIGRVFFAASGGAPVTFVDSAASSVTRAFFQSGYEAVFAQAYVWDFAARFHEAGTPKVLAIEVRQLLETNGSPTQHILIPFELLNAGEAVTEIQ